MEGISKAMVVIEGVAPILMHSNQLVDPLNYWSKKIKDITSKHHSKVTDTDREELKRLEFNGGLYFDETVGPYIPGVNIEGSIRDAARSKKQGKNVESGLIVDQDLVAIEYDGPRTRNELYEDKRFVDTRVVKLNKSASLMRTRPRFNKWSAEFEIMAINDIVSIGDVREFIELAGLTKGLCDFRPKFGRFIVKEFIVV